MERTLAIMQKWGWEKLLTFKKGKKMEGSLTFWDLQKMKAWNFCKYKLMKQCWVPDLQHKHAKHGLPTQAGLH